MFSFQDTDAKQQESWSCIWLELVKLHKLLFSVPLHCPRDCLIVLLKLSPLIPVSLLWSSSWEMERLVQIVLMRVMHRALTKMRGDQGGSVRDAQVICLICFFYSSTCRTPHSLERFTATCCQCLGLAGLYFIESWFQGWGKDSTLSLPFPWNIKTEGRKWCCICMTILRKVTLIRRGPTHSIPFGGAHITFCRFHIS